MVLYLYLVSALILGAVAAQTANVTEERPGKAEGNRTSTPANSAVKTRNVTSGLSKEERTQTEAELENNQTSALITEDDENFQDPDTKFPIRHCLHDHLVAGSHNICGEYFRTEMLSISEEHWCVLDDVIRPYNHMTSCLEEVSDYAGCYYPNPVIQDFFLHIHSLYFWNCSNKEHQLEDAPDGLVIFLTLIPVSLIPVLVHLVVRKSEVQE